MSKLTKIVSPYNSEEMCDYDYCSAHELWASYDECEFRACGSCNCDNNLCDDEFDENKHVYLDRFVVIETYNLEGSQRLYVLYDNEEDFPLTFCTFEQLITYVEDLILGDSE